MLLLMFVVTNLIMAEQGLWLLTARISSLAFSWVMDKKTFHANSIGISCSNCVVTILSKEERPLCYKLRKLTHARHGQVRSLWMLWSTWLSRTPGQNDGYKRPSNNNNCKDTMQSMNTVATMLLQPVPVPKSGAYMFSCSINSYQFGENSLLLPQVY